MKSVLADTGPLYVLATPSDGLHSRAREEAGRLKREGFSVLISYPTLFGTQSLLSRRTAPASVHRWQQSLAYSSSLITPTTGDYERAALRVERYPDQQLSLFDRLVAVLSEQFGIPVWTFDADFDIMRAEVWR